MKVLSCFDGMSCGQIALNRANIKIDKYFASEIDKYAIKVTMANYPNTIQLGDITKIKAINLPKIDLLIGGSPCQGFSLAGKQLNFNDERSKLFFEFVRLWEEIKKRNPEAKFMLENVNMKKSYMAIISKYMGVFPVRINSNLVSAQNRDRWFWTNIKTTKWGLFGDLTSDIPQPKDKKILLKDILQPDNEINKKYYLSKKVAENLMNWSNRNQAKGNGFKLEIKTPEEKSTPIITGSMKSASTYIKTNIKGIPKADQMKAACLTAGAHSGGNHSDIDLILNFDFPRDKQYICLALKRTDYGKKIRKEYESGKVKAKRKTIQQLELRNDGNTNPLTTVQKDNILTDGYKLRRLTPIECERLQTVTDNYTNHVSDSQRYKMLGNGWTVDIIAHIFKYLINAQDKRSN